MDDDDTLIATKQLNDVERCASFMVTLIMIVRGRCVLGDPVRRLHCQT